MNRPAVAICAVWCLSLAVWLGTLAQLSRAQFSSVPNRSTLTHYPGP